MTELEEYCIASGLPAKNDALYPLYVIQETIEKCGGKSVFASDCGYPLFNEYEFLVEGDQQEDCYQLLVYVLIDPESGICAAVRAVFSPSKASLAYELAQDFKDLGDKFVKQAFVIRERDSVICILPSKSTNV